MLNFLTLLHLTGVSASSCPVKECIKLFLITLPMSRQFVVPRNLKLLTVPLFQIHDNAQVC